MFVIIHKDYTKTIYTFKVNKIGGKREFNEKIKVEKKCSKNNNI